MSGRGLRPGETGEISVSLVRKDEDGKWKAVTGRMEAGDRYRARVRFRSVDGRMLDASSMAKRHGDAEKAVLAKVAQRMNDASDIPMTSRTIFLDAGREWLEQNRRSDSGKSDGTIALYEYSFNAHLAFRGSPLKTLTMEQVNSPQRLRAHLQRIADKHGTSSAKVAKSVLSGILNLALENGIVDANATKNLRPVKSQNPKPKKRDHRRALTVAEQEKLIAEADRRAAEEGLDPRTRRKRQTTADLVAFMVGTGARVSEGRRLRHDHWDLATGRTEIHGTKTASSRRVVNLPGWLLERMRCRAEEFGSTGFVFASPTFVDRPDKEWSLRAAELEYRTLLDLVGLDWAVSHTMRRTVATRLDEKGVPARRIADQLGHANIRTTIDAYFGRDFDGDKSDLADLL